MFENVNALKSKNSRPFTVGGHMTTPTLAMTK